MDRLYLLLFGATLALIVGCSETEEEVDSDAPPPPVTTQNQAVDGNANQTDTDDVGKPVEVGIGKKGHYSEGLYTTPLAAKFRTEERLIFTVQIPNAVKTFHAIHGRYPKDYEEFTEEIILENSIQLPELPDDEEYWYDPEAGQLTYRKKDAVRPLSEVKDQLPAD